MTTIHITPHRNGLYRAERVVDGVRVPFAYDLTHQDAKTVADVAARHGDEVIVHAYPTPVRRTHRALLVRFLVCLAVAAVLIFLFVALYARLVQGVTIGVWELWQQGVTP